MAWQRFLLPARPCVRRSDADQLCGMARSQGRREPCAEPTLSLCLVLIWSAVRLSLLLLVFLSKEMMSVISKTREIQRASMKQLLVSLLRGSSVKSRD